MSKTHVFHGRQFSVDTPRCGHAHFRCQCRSRSVGRPDPFGYHHDYFIPEFTRDGIPDQSPKLSNCRDRCYQSGIHKTHNHYCTRKVHGSERIEPTINVVHVEPSKPRPHKHIQDEQHYSLPLPRRYGRGLDERLKRKSVFAVRQEEKTSPSTTELQEITDMNVITSMCMATMKSMMESKRHRRFLYHLNNNAHYPQLELLHASLMENLLDGSNNFSDSTRKKQMAERVFGVNIAKPANLEEIKDRGKDIEMRQKALPRYRMDGFIPPSRFDRLEQELDRQEMSSTATDRMAQLKGESSKYESKLRKDSIRVMETKLPMATAPSMSRTRAFSKAVPRFKTFGPTDPLDRIESDADLSLIVDNPLSQREMALKLLAEIQAKIDKRKHVEEDEHPGPARVIRAITPQEALQCAWLRLSRSQIATLEDLIRQQGIEPGLHAHSDVSNYDVFAEVREIRRKEKLLKEEADERK